MATREIYANAPLRLVSLEFKFPVTTRVLTRTLWDQLESALAKDLPEVRTFPPNVDTYVPSETYDPLLRRMSEDLKRAVTVYAGAITIELANYTHFEDLRELASRVLVAFESLDDFTYSRVGLRYINEIRADLVGLKGNQWAEVKAWEPFINSELLRTVDVPPEGLHAFLGPRTIFFHSTEGPDYVSLQHGINAQGLIDPSDVLFLEGDSGPCFVLDFDAFRNDINNKVGSGSFELLEITARLNNIVESVFQWSITEQAREVFRAPARGTSEQGSFPHASDT